MQYDEKCLVITTSQVLAMQDHEVRTHLFKLIQAVTWAKEAQDVDRAVLLRDSLLEAMPLQALNALLHEYDDACTTLATAFRSRLIQGGGHE